MILEKEVTIDAAFLASPCVDDQGNISGSEGRSFCGSLGYAVADAQMAKKTIAITDTRVSKVKRADIEGRFVDMVVEVDKIGDPAGIVSGTTQITKDPIGLKIARDCRTLIEYSGLFKNGFSRSRRYFPCRCRRNAPSHERKKHKGKFRLRRNYRLFCKDA